MWCIRQNLAELFLSTSRSKSPEVPLSSGAIEMPSVMQALPCWLPTGVPAEELVSQHLAPCHHRTDDVRAAFGDDDPFTLSNGKAGTNNTLRGDGDAGAFDWAKSHRRRYSRSNRIWYHVAGDLLCSRGAEIVTSVAASHTPKPFPYQLLAIPLPALPLRPSPLRSHDTPPKAS